MSSLAILVPVLGRPHNVQPFLESLSLNTQVEHRVVFICSPGDDEEIAACRATDADVIVVPWEPGRGDFAKKINLAYRSTDEEWLFQAADDIRFTPKWDMQAFRVSNRSNANVIGTNDLGNPDVKRGQHSTHTLFSRPYIEHYGGTVDKSGDVFSEAYDHQWTDVEFVQIAMLRGEWAFAKQSIVEHFHPHWNKGEMDSTYEKATRATRDDQELYAERMRMVRQRLGRQPSSPERIAELRARRAR